MKKFITLIITLAILTTSAFSLAACGEPTLKIGIIQYTTHASLDNCRIGFVEGLKAEGIEDGKEYQGKKVKIEVVNALANNETITMSARNFVNKKYDLICAIATPCAVAAVSAAQGRIPVIFNAVSDPAAKGVEFDKANNVTGSSDILPLSAQVDMIKAFLPNAKKIGVLYTETEPNSVSQLTELKKIAAEKDMQIVERSVLKANEVLAATDALLAQGVDCLNNFTDNNVVDNLTGILAKTDHMGIPVFGSEIEQVKKGCLASQSIDYVALGGETGKMAALILSGEKKADDIPYYYVDKFTPVYNTDVLAKFSLTLPPQFADAETVTTVK